ncbi:guanylate kinase [Tunicatimonas pelagia]|uniref:guanylate kinase n=1 Tax=Tunicatimonas pelagia TaxID=931531 RepID=UPI0026651D04|nr:guanylate kinase [Tunicatimonas pelagia]WKN44496.1 guanylate kinase [Tunicatimonas pelagia]
MSPFQGKAIIFSAPSGSGKTTLVHYLLAVNPNLSFSISATTREQRGSETHERDYYFFSPNEFRQQLQKDAFIEWQEVYPDRYYGTLKSEIDRIWRSQKNVIFDVDVKGGINLKSYFGDRALAVFVRPPSLEALKDRLLARNTDSAQSIQHRLEKTEYELGFEKYFDATVVNDDLEKAKQEVQQLYQAFTR